MIQSPEERGDEENVILGIIWLNDDQAAIYFRGLVFGVVSILTAVGFAQLPEQPTFLVTVDEQEQKFDTTRSPRMSCSKLRSLLIL
jgi:hypothetical protein